ncbi:hypothetical protein DCO48_14115 [Pseudomonas sp. SDI]|nr:hypothetical protein DCO48_14115 [Pseudomonas sp. SDI]
MGEIFFYLVFILLSTLFLIPALWMRCHWSGADLKFSQFLISVAYNLCFFYIHWNFLETGTLPLVGKKSITIIGWYSLLMSLTHGFSLPRGKEVKFLCKRKKNSL